MQSTAQIGKIDNAEIDFIATKPDDKIYIQVTESMISEGVRKYKIFKFN